jgi:hypothetical protein
MLDRHPIITTLIEHGGYSKPSDGTESDTHAILRCALERLEALERSRAAGNYLTVIPDREGTYEDGEERWTAFLSGDPTGGVGAEPEVLASLGGIDVGPPHAYYVVVEADLAMEVVPAEA